MIVNLADACIVIGEIERENASLKERIAELEYDLSLAAELTGEAQMRVSELEQQLVADKKQAYAEGIKEGMERAADIVQSEYGPNYVKGDVAAGIIRKDLDNE